ncbi:hypothetical protein GCM10010420_29860 [Streptomyces glaucosporus]|uniref:Integral membrane protein n=1 Tax=Streptomyces glaucosporus TaxID=284044 RepID=A0ABN3ICQ3_9ACTN
MSPLPGRHGPADPVRVLLHRHRELCERAVDPLEIAAVLETHGITDRTAARYRHRDVFSLAEELYARTPRAGESRAEETRAAPERAPRRAAARVRAALLPLVPGGWCAATLGVPVLAGDARPALRYALMGVGALLAAVSAWLCLRLCPGRGGDVRPSRSAVLGSCWLTGYALVGDRLLARALDGAAEAAAPLAERCVPLGLAAAVAPAVWCARRFAAQAERRLRASRDLKGFAARTRPLLAATVAVFAATLAALLTAAHVAVDGGTARDALGAPVAAATALGTLLFVAVLLTSHGFRAAAAGGIAAACLVEVAALAAAWAARRPGLAHLGRPVEALTDTWGPAAVPAAACAAAALALSAFAARALTGASAHHRGGP